MYAINLTLRIVLLFAFLALTACSSLRGPSRYDSYIIYTVQAGDTLLKIGQRFNVGTSQIIELNNLRDPSVLVVGQKIKLPYKGQASRNTNLSNLKDGVSPNSLKTVQLSEARKHIGRLLWPVTNGKVSSKFGKRWGNFHEGIDIVAKEGTRIHAAHDGIVVYSGSGLKGYGNLVILKGDAILSVYAHNQKNLVSKGADIIQGQAIALLGRTGKATGPHLHYEIRVKDQKGLNIAVDPLAFYPIKAR